MLPNTYSLYLIILCLMGSLVSKAQDTTFFDRNWDFCPAEYQYFYRVVEKKGDVYEFRTHYSEDDRPQRLAYFTSDEVPEGQIDPNGKTGEWTHWHYNGQVQSVEDHTGKPAKMISGYSLEGEKTVAEGTGHQKFYDHRGELMMEGDFEDGYRAGLWTSYFRRVEQVTVRSKEEMKGDQQHGKYSLYYSEGGLRREGQYENGKRVGTWKWYTPSGKLLDEHTFTGKEKMRYPDKDVIVYPVPLNMAKIKKEIGYPPEAVRQEVEGRVVVQVLVNEKGKVERHKLIFTTHSIFALAVEKNVERLKFTPGTIATEKSEFWITYPFDFNLKR